MVGKNLGRPGHACRDKWRMMRNNPKSGDWSPDEVARLRELVNEYFAQNNAAPGRGAGRARGLWGPPLRRQQGVMGGR